MCSGSRRGEKIEVTEFPLSEHSKAQLYNVTRCFFGQHQSSYWKCVHVYVGCNTSRTLGGNVAAEERFVSGGRAKYPSFTTLSSLANSEQETK